MIDHLLDDSRTHALWLNTLSYLENCGARAIAACEHPYVVREEMLKHAAEEFRHAYFFKAQIRKVHDRDIPDYTELLGGYETRFFLHRLNTQICRLLKKKYCLVREQYKYAAYLLVTYAIEKRAEEIYPAYQEALQQRGLPVSVAGVIREEAHHLAEIEREMPSLPRHEEMAADVLEIEEGLFKRLWQKVESLTP